jgi:hypothetical protein
MFIKILNNQGVIKQHLIDHNSNSNLFTNTTNQSSINGHSKEYGFFIFQQILRRVKLFYFTSVQDCNSNQAISKIK